MRTKDTVARYVDVFALIVKAPRTSAELAELAAINLHTVRKLANALHSEGLVTRECTPRTGKARTPFLWRWAA